MPAHHDAEPDLHTVVFDLNILLDVADLLGPPYTWDKFRDAAARDSQAPVPNRADSRIDSLRAVALTTTGRFAGQELLEVWTSDHIADLLVLKAGSLVTGPPPKPADSDGHKKTPRTCCTTSSTTWSTT